MANPVFTVVGVDEVKNLIKNLPNAWYKEVRQEYKDAAFRVHEKVSLRIRDGKQDTLHSRSGQLRRSLKTAIRGTNINTLGSEVFSDKSVASYAPTHEFGKTIKAKKAYSGLPGGPYLNIPLDENKTPAGVMRMSARDVFQRGGFIIPSIGPKARYVVMMPLGTAPITKKEFEEYAGFGASSIPMFALVKQVKIEPRLKMHQTGIDEIPTFLSKLSTATSLAINSANK